MSALLGALGAPRIVGYLATAFCVLAVLGDSAGFWNVRHGLGQGIVIVAMIAAVGGLALARRGRRAP